MPDWWAASLEKDLSQGDVISSLLIPVMEGQTFLRKETVAKVGSVWLESEWTPSNNGLGHYLGRGKRIGALVLTHSCELDKRQGKGRVLVAPIAHISTVSDQQAADNIMAQRRVSQMPLPAIPGLGDCYADLRVLGTVERALAEQMRVASMTEDALGRLHAQLVGYLTRRELPNARRGDRAPNQDA